MAKIIRHTHEESTTTRTFRRTTEESLVRAKSEEKPKKEVPEFAKGLSGISARFPKLKEELAMAGMDEHTPLTFTFFAAQAALFLAATLLLVTYLFLPKENTPWLLLLLLLPIYFALSFLYFMSYPRVRANERARRIDSELLFAGRHLLIGLRAGIPLYDAMSAVTTGYGEASREFAKIIHKMSLGTPASAAMHEVASASPSLQFRRVVLQLSNAMASGSDVADSLESVLNQISREQAVLMREYGQKLNPLVMFFMIFGVVFPSLGIAIGSILFSFAGGGQANGPAMLLSFFIVVALFQFIFLTIAESSRPKFELS